jgi:DNA-binding NarL/FixJ family response regulator
MIHVLLVDDQVMVRTGFRMILEAESDLLVVGEAANGLEAIEESRQKRPDVILMDIRMPKMDGIEATARINELAGNTARVLMLTTFDVDDYVYAALRAGASGFLLKDAPPEQLIDAIHVIANGDALLAPSVTRRLIEEVAKRPTPSTQMVPGLADLTDREREVLVLVARGLSNGEIAESLYLGEATVKTHLGRMLTKLGVRDRVQAVVLAYETGVVTPGS